MRVRVFKLNLGFAFDDNFVGDNADVETVVCENYKSFFFLNMIFEL